MVAKAAPDAARPAQTQIVIVATNALSDYDVVNFDLTNVTAEEGRADERESEGTAMIDIHRTSVTENCQKVCRPCHHANMHCWSQITLGDCTGLSQEVF